MLSIRSLLVFLILCLPGIAAAQPNPALPSDLVHRIEAAERAWIDAILTEPLLVSLGAFPDLSNAGAQLTSVLRDRLKLLDRKVISNRQWGEHWTEQHRAAAELESLYGELASTATGADERAAADARQATARDWTALADSKMSNQDDYLISIKTERDSVEERLENARDSALPLDAKQAPLATSVGATPFEERAARIAELRFQQNFQSERRAAASLELKLVKQQAESSVLLHHALKKDVELSLEEQRIAKAQLLSSDPQWSKRWLPIAEAARAKAKKIEQELHLSAERQHSIEFEVNLAESKTAYRDQKHGEIEQERQQAEALSGWLEAVFSTARQQAPRVLGALLLVFLAGRLALWLVALTARTLIKVVQDDDPDHISAFEQRANTIASVFRGVGKIAIYVVGTLVAFDVVGIDTGPLLGSVAILGLALSFGSQNLVRDLVNGFFILVENQYSVGDWVKIDSHEGTVEQINIRSTRLRSVTGVLQIIPNGTIATVENMTRDWSCFRCHVGVSYDTDIDLAERICNEVGAAMYADPALKHNLLEAPTFIGVTELGDSAVVLRSQAKTRAGAQWGLEREMNRRLKKAFEEAGIEIPFPQQVVWHRNKPSGPEA
jgi:small conductance mechanosensitive channel